MPGTVQFHHVNAGTNSSTLQVWARKLHELLLAAGWTLEYANADAIGTGSASSPAFDKAPAASTSGGVVVYKMPLNGQATPWFVRIEPQWAAGTGGSNSFINVQIGTGQSGGVLANPSTAVVLATASTSFANNGSELFVSAHPDAFCVCLTGTNANWLVSVGRRINLAGETLDDLVTSLIASANVTVSGPSGIVPEGSCVTRSAQSGELSAQRFVAFTSPGASATTCVQPNTLNLPAAASGFPLGPYLTSGGLQSLPRLWMMVADNDSVAGTDQMVRVDGQDRLYLVASSSTAMRWHGRLALARQ